MIKKEKDINDTIMNVTLIILIGIALILVGGAIGEGIVDVAINQETADDICQQITNETSAVASDDNTGINGGRLICTVPSYDSTQNIIIKSNNK